VLGAHDVDRQVSAVLTGLGFRTVDFTTPVAALSGGWQMRVALARILLQKPELLLLDEPTNHLDLEAREWLEGYLQDYPYAFVIVSHDRFFLDVTVARVSEITDYRLDEYKGNYSAHETEREERLVRRQQAYRRQQEEIRRIERFIERFRYKNTKSVQVQSRIKMLAKMERLSAPTAPPRGIVMPLPPAPRSGKVVLELKGLRKAYGENVVLDGIDLRILRGARVALVGPNGAGKSTLMRALSGRESPDGGERIAGHNVLPAFFAQDHAQELNGSQTVLETVKQRAPTDFLPSVRGLLGAFLFSGDAVDKRVSVLSGGERNRLALACLLVRPTNVLLLDEPTNHLDITSKDVLLDALRSYAGTVVFVSHDRHFLAALADHVIEVGGGSVREFPGEYDGYLYRRAHEAQGEAQPPGAEARGERGPRHRDPGEGPPSTARPGRQKGKQGGASVRRRERRLGELEAQIGELEERRKRYNAAMSSPDFFANQARADLYLRQLDETEAELTDLYQEWEKLAE
jgi:ATP-binding cassette subfamily F protein 3